MRDREDLKPAAETPAKKARVKKSEARKAAAKKPGAKKAPSASASAPPTEEAAPAGDFDTFVAAYQASILGIGV